MICKRCGASLTEGQRFCARCGAAVEAAGPNTVSAASPAPEASAAVAAPPARPPRARRAGLWIGAAAAVLLLALGAAALLRAASPAAYLFGCLTRTAETLAAEQAALRDNLGLDLPADKSDAALRLQLDALPLDGPEAGLLRGLGLTLRVRSDLAARQMQYTCTLGTADLSLLSADAWIDARQLAVRSPELTDGAWYGLPAQGFGAQVNRLAGKQVLDPALDLDPFDAAQSAAENGSVLRPETGNALWEATRALLDTVELARETGVAVNAQGQDRQLDRVTAAVSREALTLWLNTCADALLADPYMTAALNAPHLTEEEVRQAIGELTADLPDAMQLVFLIQDRQVVRLSLCANGAEWQLELGMDGVLSDTLALRMVEADGAEAMAFVMSGAHTAPDGHLTSSGRLSRRGQTPLTFLLDLDAKQTADNLTAELRSVDDWGLVTSLRVQGSWAADPGAHTLALELARLELDADGTAVAFSGELTVAPCEGLTGPDQTPRMLSDMTDDELAQLTEALQANLRRALYRALLGMVL